MSWPLIAAAVYVGLVVLATALVLLSLWHENRTSRRRRPDLRAIDGGRS